MDNMSEFSSVEYYTLLIIAIAFSVLVFQVVERTLNMSNVYAKCPSVYSDDEVLHNGVKMSCRDVYTDSYNRHLMYMTVLSVVGLLVGGSLYSSGRDTMVVGSGVALGSALVLAYSIIYNWSYINTDVRIVMLAGTVGLLGYGSTKFY